MSTTTTEAPIRRSSRRAKKPSFDDDDDSVTIHAVSGVAREPSGRAAPRSDLGGYASLLLFYIMNNLTHPHLRSPLISHYLF
jgi:hypothetical protein